MSLKIRVSAGRKVSTVKGNGEPAFGSYCAGVSITFELDPDLMENPAAFVGKIREHQDIARAAMNEELAKLKAQSNGQAGPAAGQAAAADPKPTKTAAGRQPVATPRRAAAAQVDEEMEEYQEEQARELPEDDDPPLDGKHLLGWARNQPTDAKGWLIGFGRKKRYPNRILNWTPVQVKTAYDVFRQAHR